MGFKKSNVEIKKVGITLPEAYAQVDSVRIGLSGDCVAGIKIQTSRESMDKPALDTVYVRAKIDKTQPIFTQVYEAAKKEVFADWEDDIVE